MPLGNPFNIYRELPELRDKTQAEQARLIHQAAYRRGDALWVVPMGAALLAAAVWGGVGFGIVRLILSSRAASNAPTNAAGRVELPNGVTTLLVSFGVIVFFMAWAIVRRVMLINSLYFLVNKVSCPFCRFSLMGLRPEGPMVRCPECGERFNLFDHGMHPEHLLSELDRRRPFIGAGPMGSYAIDPKRDRERAAARPRSGSSPRGS